MTWVRIETQSGDQCFVPIHKIKPISCKDAVDHQKSVDLKRSFPLFVDGLLMHASRNCFVKDWELFKAVATGHHIDLKYSKQNLTKGKVAK